MRKRILAVLLIVVMVLGLISCGEKKEDLTGKWIGEDEYFELYSDGTGIVTSLDDDGNEETSYAITWIAENGRLKITFDLGMLGTISSAADYELSKSTLICTFDDDGTTEEYHRE